jgi:hypothetical protein
VKEILEQLCPDERNVFLLVAIARRSVGDVSSILGVSEAVIQRRLADAMEATEATTWRHVQNLIASPRGELKAVWGDRVPSARRTTQWRRTRDLRRHLAGLELGGLDAHR